MANSDDHSSDEKNLSVSVCCPFCRSAETRREADFGTTLAYAQFYCAACRTPFEWIKWEDPDKFHATDLPSLFASSNKISASD